MENLIKKIWGTAVDAEQLAMADEWEWEEERRRKILFGNIPALKFLVIAILSFSIFFLPKSVFPNFFLASPLLRLIFAVLLLITFVVFAIMLMRKMDDGYEDYYPFTKYVATTEKDRRLHILKRMRENPAPKLSNVIPVKYLIEAAVKIDGEKCFLIAVSNLYHHDYDFDDDYDGDDKNDCDRFTGKDYKEFVGDVTFKFNDKEYILKGLCLRKIDKIKKSMQKKGWFSISTVYIHHENFGNHQNLTIH